MLPAEAAAQRPVGTKLLVVGSEGALTHTFRSDLLEHLRPGDLLVANDAATIPASLHGTHLRSGGALEVRLAGRGSLAPNDVRAFLAVVFGAGDHRTRTEDRLPPPELLPRDLLGLGPLTARVTRPLGHPRLVELSFLGPVGRIWEGIARHGRPIQYAHVPEPLALWDVWTRVAAAPVAFEPPSAGFVLNWGLIGAMSAHGVTFATLTLAAGISSTGDPELDASLPFDEAYRIPEATVRATASAKAAGGRVIAVGTTVTRALEHAARGRSLPRAGEGLAHGRVHRSTELTVVDAILTGVHAPGESHYELLRAFASKEDLERASAAAEARGYRAHEFGDSMLVERRSGAAQASAPSPPYSEIVGLT